MAAAVSPHPTHDSNLSHLSPLVIPTGAYPDFLLRGCQLRPRVRFSVELTTGFADPRRDETVRSLHSSLTPTLSGCLTFAPAYVG
jgi:hypothetical protein